MDGEWAHEFSYRMMKTMSLICFLVDLTKYVSYTFNLEQLDTLNHKILPFEWLEFGRKLKGFRF
ncbi:hypothetical protein H5410_001465 [Solanum commersonii]|uniref:Uncharacterized protein n=1 Tax=Solanum commersonii TaxID=4109 RepID=A0A9J6AZ95_SOLCO|nr:hypothetical protein H5410_001465 [Solanum commersonii]